MAVRLILHDYLQVNGGAERLVLTAGSGLKDCEVVVSGLYAPELSANFGAESKLRVLKRAVFLPRVPRAFLTFSFPATIPRSVEAVMYSGVFAPLAVKAQLNGTKVYYCHTEPRFAFDRSEEYLARFPRAMRYGLALLLGRYRRSYLAAVKQMDLVLCNSHHVRQRLSGLGVSASVVYPPIDTQKFRWIDSGDFFLSVGRIEPNKRIDRLVAAFLQMPEKKLVVASGGSELAKMKRLAMGASNIVFTDWISDEQLAQLVGRCRACLYIPRDEDFGMSAVEAMAAGKPVIAVDEGGLRETVVHDRTGYLLVADPKVEDIVTAVHKMTGEVALAMRDPCIEQSEKFSKERFIEEIRGAMRDGSVIPPSIDGLQM